MLVLLSYLISRLIIRSGLRISHSKVFSSSQTKIEINQILARPTEMFCSYLIRQKLKGNVVNRKCYSFFVNCWVTWNYATVLLALVFPSWIINQSTINCSRLIFVECSIVSTCQAELAVLATKFNLIQGTIQYMEDTLSRIRYNVHLYF